MIVTNADFNNHRAALLAVGGNATLGGSMKLLAASILPRIALPVLDVAGMSGGSLSVQPSPLFTYALGNRAGQYSVSMARANFAPQSIALTPLERSIATHLGNVFGSGANTFYDTLFASLDSLAGSNRQLRPAGRHGARRLAAADRP